MERSAEPLAGRRPWDGTRLSLPVPPAAVGLLAASGLLAITGLGCDSRLPDGTALVPVERLVDAENAHDRSITLSLPVATVRDDTRLVLRAPPRRLVLWPKTLEDRSGNRLLNRLSVLPDALRSSTRLLVRTQVRVGPRWFEPPPEVVATSLRGRHPSVLLKIPIPANPEAQPVVVTAEATSLDAVDLEQIDTPALTVPANAVLEFAIGLIEPDWGSDPVRFSVLACEAKECETLFSEVFDPNAGEGADWSDQRISLSGLAGRSVSLRFVAEPLAGEAPFSLPVWANPTVYAPESREPDERNVILLSIDTLRADHLNSYGYHHETAPFVAERFERAGTVFDTLVAAATITTPSHATMFTALSPAAHAATDGLKVLPSSIPTLAERARHAGIDTAAFTENGWLGVKHGFGRGFDRFVENKSANIMDPDGQADRTFGQAREWLRHNRDKRFFLFLHTFQVHTPYAPPPRYAELFSQHPSGHIDDASPSHLRWMAEYDREIRYTDDELRRLFETIDDLGLGENTVFVLTSDHGEAFLEHGVLEHGARMDEEAVHVPLMLWGSGIPAGRRVQVPVGHVDLMPSILDWLGVDKPASIEGLSLLPLLPEGADDAAYSQRPLYSESRGVIALGPDRNMLAFHPPAYLVRVGNRKLARYRTGNGGYRYEYYDLASDPLERTNEHPARAEESRDLRELLDGYEERGQELRARLDRGEAGESEPVFLDPRQEEKLRALGYIE